MVLILWYNKISSTYSFIVEVTFRGISFTKHRKRRGAKTVPWGTPEVTVEESLLIPSIVITTLGSIL